MNGEPPAPAPVERGWHCPHCGEVYSEEFDEDFPGFTCECGTECYWQDGNLSECLTCNGNGSGCPDCTPGASW